MWTPMAVMQRLEQQLLAQGANDAQGWTLGAASVSADGRTIVGGGKDPKGRFQAWVATLPAVLPLCVADCDDSGGNDLFDFLCFVDAFNAGDTYADCEPQRRPDAV